MRQGSFFVQKVSLLLFETMKVTVMCIASKFAEVPLLYLICFLHMAFFSEQNSGMHNHEEHSYHL